MGSSIISDVIEEDAEIEENFLSTLQLKMLAGQLVSLGILTCRDCNQNRNILRQKQTEIIS